MITDIVLLLTVFLALLLCGTHIAVALGVTSIVYMAFIAGFPLSFVTHAFIGFLNNYALMAIPLFVFAGYAMAHTGLVVGLFDFSESLTTRFPAGLGVATMVACMFVAALTGSAVAEASIMATTALPEMRRRDYDDEFSSGIIAVGGTLGILIPPSIPLIVYGIICEISIPQLFMAGMVPGICLGLLLCVMVMFQGHRRGHGGHSTDWRAIWRTGKKAIWVLLMPAVVLGGLYSGVFTPTEAGGVACVYPIAFALAGYNRWQFIRSIPSLLTQSLRTVSMIFLILGAAGIFMKVLAVAEIPQTALATVLAISLSPWVFLLIVNVAYLIMGMFLDVVAIFAITLPVAFPIAMALGIHPLAFAVMVTVNAGVATITPPVGFNLYALSGIGKIPIHRVFRGVVPFMLVQLAFLVFVVCVPSISTFLPELIWP